MLLTILINMKVNGKEYIYIYYGQFETTKQTKLLASGLLRGSEKRREGSAVALQAQ